jgi:hypothetical protein
VLVDLSQNGTEMYNDRQQPEVLYARQVLGATERAMARAGSMAHEDLKRGLNTLATIACAAPLAGVLGTLFGLICDTFLGAGGDRSTGMALVADRIATACACSAFGILIGVQALWAYRYFRGRLAEFDGEMAMAAPGLINSLVPHLDRLRSRVPNQKLGDSLPYLAAYSSDVDAYRRYRLFTTLGLLLVPWSMQVVVGLRSFEFDAMWFIGLVLASLWSPIIVFCCWCLPVYAVWVDLLHRKPRDVAPIAAALALVWRIAGLMYPGLRFW